MIGPPEAHIFMFWMSRVADGIEVVGISGRTSNLLWRAAASGIEQEWQTVRRRVVEPFFKLDHMVPAVAEVIEIMDRLRAGLANDIAEPRLAGIDGLGAKIAIGIRDTPTPFASQELEEMAIRPTKRRLKRQMQPIKGAARAARQGSASTPHVLKGHLDPDGGRVEAHAASLGWCACIVYVDAQGSSSSSRAIGQPLTSLARTSESQCSALMLLSLQVSINDASTAQLSAPSSQPAKREFLTLSLIGRIARSTAFVSISMRPSSR